MIQIAVIGSGEPKNEQTLRIAEEVGREIAKRGAVLVCGGLGGVMEAACRGAKEEGGITIGIIPTDDPKDANKYVDIRIVTGLSWARNQIVALSCDGVIMLEGEAGTLSEACIAWIYNKPIVAVPSTGGYAKEMAGRKVDEKRRDYIMGAKDGKEAVELLFKLIRGD